jgi:hypothetical protein
VYYAWCGEGRQGGVGAINGDGQSVRWRGRRSRCGSRRTLTEADQPYGDGAKEPRTGSNPAGRTLLDHAFWPLNIPRWIYTPRAGPRSSGTGIAPAYREDRRTSIAPMRPFTCSANAPSPQVLEDLCESAPLPAPHRHDRAGHHGPAHHRDRPLLRMRSVQSIFQRPCHRCPCHALSSLVPSVIPTEYLRDICHPGCECDIFSVSVR